MTRYILDTNLIVRFLRGDHPTMSRAASENASVASFDRDFDRFSDITRLGPVA